MNKTAAVLLATSLGAMSPQGVDDPGSRHLSQSLVIASTALIPPLEFQGVFGRLRVELGSAIVLPFDENRGSVSEFLEAVGPAAQMFYFQVLRQDELGLHLSTLRRVGEDRELRFAQTESLEACRIRAETCIAEAVGTSVAEGWRGNPLVLGASPLFRPDVSGVAYFEFAVDQGGFIVVATGEHDVPITNWSSRGAPPSALLRQRAQQQSRVVARVLKVDSLTWVAEDANGAMIDKVGELPNQLHDVPALVDESTPEFRPLLRAWPSWRALKVGFSESYRPYLRRQAAAARERWEADRVSGGPSMTSDWSSWTTYEADGGSSEQPYYDQFTYGSCYVGCGPVAWAMLFGWGDRQAHDGNPAWSSRTGLYRTGGGTSASGASSSAVAPLAMDSGIENVIEELNGWVDTYCLFGGGATWPSDMDEAQGYLSARTSATCTGTDSNTFITSSSKREDARDSIKDRDTPVIIGTSMGGGLHYPVAFKYRWRSKTNWLGGTSYDREFYVNPGWGSTGSFQWIEAKTWFVGQLYP
ncbi:MAG: hypothetical protein IT457_07370 [Planctomycetes bacterium]|nr:hypothetical protein [Planctomycetota bacterium]